MGGKCLSMMHREITERALLAPNSRLARAYLDVSRAAFRGLVIVAKRMDT